MDEHQHRRGAVDGRRRRKQVQGFTVAVGWQKGIVTPPSDSDKWGWWISDNAGIFALIQFVIVLVWSRSGMMLTAFFPAPEGDTRALVEFLLIGSAIGSVFAALTFAASAFSLPMIADREVDMVTACLSSINAVLRNKLVMLEWALIICVLTAIGFASALVGLGVVMPWLAYATYHAYRETIDASTWPEA